MRETPAVTTLGRYVPSVALTWPGEAATGELPLHRAVDGTLMFIDVSGFTALSERLAQRGKVGAEQLTDVLNAVFGTMLGLAATRGGTLLKFGGDALFLLYTGPDHAAQAASSAVELRAALAHATKTPGPAGRLHLRMSVGVHSGAVDLFLVGSSHRELVVAGPATTAVAAMEAAASAGQILLSPDTAVRLPPSAVGDALGPGRLLRWRTAHAPLPTADRDAAAEHDAARFVPTALRELLAAAEPESEHRTAGVAFLRYTGLDVLLARDPQDAADALGTLVTTAQLAADEQGVTFLATDLAEDGGKIILVAGFPVTAEDDQGRLLRAACDVVATASRQSWPLAVEAGVNRGHVFAGAVGSAQRATVTVMGDTVNLAARVMAKADPGCVLATPAVLDAAQTLFATQPVEPFMVKGKSRPVTAYLVGDETGTRPPRGLGALPFVGRDAEVAAVYEALDAVRSGRGGVVAVTGDAGMGKSRLLSEAVAARPSLRVLDARAEPYGAASPYRPIREPVKRLLGLTHVDAADVPVALCAALARLAPALVPWAPLIGDVVGVPVAPTAATEDLDPQFRPERTATAVVQLLCAATDGPLVMMFDDAHYSDDATAALTARIERETATRPWLLLCALREGDEGGYHPTDGALVRLAPLADDASRALVQIGTQAAPLRPHEVETVVARAAGNPLFLEETLRNLREHGDIDALPSSLEGMVAAQIDALPPLARRLVRRASVLGRSFRVVVLADLFEEERLALDDATRKELADVLEDDGEGRLRFRHALLRDAAYDSLPYEQRRALHLRAAASTMRLAAGNPESFADNLALHYSMGGDSLNTWHWARVAAEQAQGAFALPEAAAQYQRALEAARRLPQVPAGELVTTWSSLGDAWLQAGRLEQSLEAYLRAFRLAEDAAARVVLLTSTARVRERAGRYRSAHRDLTRAERLLASTDEGLRRDESARLLSMRATVLLGQNRFGQAERQAARAIGAARSAGDDESLARSLNVLATAEVMLGRGDPAGHWREALAVRERRGELADQAAITVNLGGLAWFAGRWDEARELYERSAQAAVRSGDVVVAALSRANLGELLVAQGRLDEAGRVLAEAAATLRAVGYREGAAFAESQLGRAGAKRGDVGAARDSFTRLLEELDAQLPAEAVDLACALAEAELDAGDPGRGLEVIDTALAAASEGAGVYSAAAERVRGRALTRLGRRDEARAALDVAIAEADANGLGYERALLRLAEQELAVASNAPVDQAEVDRAIESLAQLGVLPEAVTELVTASVTSSR
jgi:class 3 adenylate cyclase/tetratricopeptide (TPR) repeat protein